MRSFTMLGIALAACAMMGNANAASIVDEMSSGNLSVGLGANPTSDDLYSVLHTNAQGSSFTDVYSFSLSNPGSASASYGSFSFQSLFGLSVSSFNLYTSAGKLVTTGSISVSGSTSSGSVTDSALSAGSYYYQLKGTVTGMAGGSYTFAQAAAPVPEPSTYALMLTGLAAVGYAAWRQRRKTGGLMSGAVAA